MRVIYSILGFSDKRDRNTGQATAIMKRTEPNTCDAIGDCDTCQVTAIIERIIANTRNTVWNHKFSHQRFV